MTDLDQIFHQRRSVRAFAPTPVSQENIIAMLEAARSAPSACNSQTWRFVVVSEKETIRKICQDAMRPIIPNKWLEQAPLIIVGCSHLDLIANRLGSGISGIEYYQIDLGIAMEHIVLKATELGLGTCWIGWFNEEKIREILNIPKKIKVSALLAVGYAADEPPQKRIRKPLEQIAFAEAWNKPIRRNS